MVIVKRAVGAGAFVLIGLLLFAVALFMIGDRRMLFERRFTVYSRVSTARRSSSRRTPVRVAGAGAGEVVDIRAARQAVRKVPGEVGGARRHSIR